MANQTAHLNVSMMNEQGNSSVNGVERAEENLYSFSSDELEEMYSFSTPDTCGDHSSAVTSVSEVRADYGGPCKARPRSRAEGDD